MDHILVYAKGYAVILGGILTSIAAILPEVPLWLKIVIAAATAVSVLAVPNKPTEALKEKIIADAILMEYPNRGV